MIVLRNVNSPINKTSNIRNEHKNDRMTSMLRGFWSVNGLDFRLETESFRLQIMHLEDKLRHWMQAHAHASSVIPSPPKSPSPKGVAFQREGQSALIAPKIAR